MSDTARLETFSDGIFAIAATLLILDVNAARSGHGRALVLSALIALVYVVERARSSAAALRLHREPPRSRLRPCGRP